jgi:hypothetical protein
MRFRNRDLNLAYDFVQLCATHLCSRTCTATAAASGSVAKPPLLAAAASPYRSAVAASFSATPASSSLRTTPTGQCRWGSQRHPMQQSWPPASCVSTLRICQRSRLVPQFKSSSQYRGAPGLEDVRELAAALESCGAFRQAGRLDLTESV